jgi:hypothetical protein
VIPCVVETRPYFGPQIPVRLSGSRSSTKEEHAFVSQVPKLAGEIELVCSTAGAVGTPCMAKRVRHRAADQNGVGLSIALMTPILSTLSSREDHCEGWPGTARGTDAGSPSPLKPSRIISRIS